MSPRRDERAPMTHDDWHLLWFLSLFGALASVTAKLGHALFGVAATPPIEAVELAHWRRKRRWLVISNFSALPLFATIAVAMTLYFDWPPVTCVLISMVCGALGFGFLLNGLQILVLRKLELEQPK